MNTLNDDRMSLSLFDEYAPFWHLWTPENHEIIFPDDDYFKAGMDIMGICARLLPGARVITFALMSNHVHIAFSGDRQSVFAFFNLFRKYLSRYMCGMGKSLDDKAFECSLREVSTLEDLRNVIAYINRNGYLVDINESPYTYPWGANQYYFNRSSALRFKESKTTMTFRQRRELTRSTAADRITEPLTMLDGCACPMSYCDIPRWLHLFRNARQYFYFVSKRIESMKAIADEVGDRVFYTDDELFAVVRRISSEKYGIDYPTQLPAAAKLEVARTMHSGYNASNKQIRRMLRLDASIVDRLFPGLPEDSKPPGKNPSRADDSWR